MSKGITLKFGKDRRSQASVAHLFAALLGKEPPPTCDKCGGIKTEDGPLSGRCECPKPESPNDPKLSDGGPGAAATPPAAQGEGAGCAGASTAGAPPVTEPDERGPR